MCSLSIEGGDYTLLLFLVLCLSNQKASGCVTMGYQSRGIMGCTYGSLQEKSMSTQHFESFVYFIHVMRD